MNEIITEKAIFVVITDGGRKAAGLRKAPGDCVARAVAIASERPYAEVHAALSAGMASRRLTRGRKRKTTADNGVSVRDKWFRDYMTRLGFEWVPTMQIGSGCKVHLRASELPLGRLVVSLSKHYCAVLDRVVHDTYDPSRFGTRCVYGYWKFNA